MKCDKVMATPDGVEQMNTDAVYKAINFFRYTTELNGCIVWNAHNTVFGSKRSAICATV